MNPVHADIGFRRYAASARRFKELGFDAVTHGFRSSFRDYAAERTHTPRTVMEAALAHVVRNKDEAAYGAGGYR